MEQGLCVALALAQSGTWLLVRLERQRVGGHLEGDALHHGAHERNHYKGPHRHLRGCVVDVCSVLAQLCEAGLSPCTFVDLGRHGARLGRV